MGGLLMVISFVMTPTTSSAAPARPQQVGPSSYIPLLRNNYCSGQRSTDIPLGTQLYGSTGYNQPHFRLLQDTRSPWLRNTLHWSAVEPTNVAPNQYNWSGAESTFLATTQNCLNMIVTIEGTPDWAVMDGNIDGRSPIKPENVADFVEFVTALVERYDGDGIADSPRGIVVNHWEIYNEPDFGSEIGGHEGWGNYAQNYADLLKAIYAPMHAANPNVKVVLGGIAYNAFVENGYWPL